MSASCVACASAMSPEEARFCVACGYARRQKCPNESCPAWLEVRRERPASVCGTCKRFLRVCPSCRRFSSLGAGSCPTPRCARAHVVPVEPNPIFLGGRGPLEGTPSVPVEDGAPRPSETWDFASPAGLLWGVASRYGRLVGASGERLSCAICTRFISKTTRELRWVKASSTLEALGEPLSNDFPFVPSPSALGVEGGHVYLAGQEGALRFDLGRTESAPQLLRIEREEAAPKPQLDWSGWDESAPPALATEVAASALPVRWRLACATRSKFVMLGERGNAPVALGHPHLDATFRGAVSPVSVADFPAPSSWCELLAWDESAWLISASGVWKSDDEGEAWRLVWAPVDARVRLRGAVGGRGELWVWGEGASGVNVWRFGAKGILLGAPASFALREVMCAPSVLGGEIVFAGTGFDGAPVVVCGRVALGEVARPPLGFPVGARAVAVMALERGEQKAVLLALESNGRVALQATTFGARTQTFPLGEPLSLFDDGAASFAWCLADDRLIVLWRAPSSGGSSQMGSPVARLLEVDLARAPFWEGA